MPRSIDVSPPRYNGPIHPLDKSAFHKEIPVIAIRVPPAKTASIAKSPLLKNYIVRFPRLSPVVRDPSNQENRLVVLNINDKAELSPEASALLERDGEGFVDYTIELDYDFWHASDILGAVLPEELVEGAPVGFAATGHIAHLNLNDEYLPYKYLIGEVFLDKNNSISTVVNKLHNIDTQFRVFQMELLAGKPNYVVTHSESNCRFTFDFSKVYWNSRLATEHERIVKLLSPDDVLADVFAGVGPFAIPAAKYGCGVLANDLNPSSYQYLVHNIMENDVSELVRATCEDGRDFIRDVFRRPIKKPFPAYTGPRKSKTRARKERKGAEGASDYAFILPPRDQITHLVMNLPDSAIEFLDTFRGVLAAPELREKYTTMPMVHCHCFTREAEEEKAHAIFWRVALKLGRRPAEDVSLFHVRSVAPGKEMYCISFRLPREWH
ncbi:Met-10+ like-protein-domain-containing protein [Mucidula mucida]|nr:Met-10+ like-protein-domain-containing protein [Mucidula mucida]